MNLRKEIRKVLKENTTMFVSANRDGPYYEIKGNEEQTHFELFDKVYKLAVETGIAKSEDEAIDLVGEGNKKIIKLEHDITLDFIKRNNVKYIIDLESTDDNEPILADKWLETTFNVRENNSMNLRKEIRSVLNEGKKMRKLSTS